MSGSMRTRLLALLALVAASAGLGGCVAYPAGYGYGGPYYAGPPVAAYGTWGGHRGWHHHRHHHRGYHRGW
jgi:hypothetical protein